MKNSSFTLLAKFVQSVGLFDNAVPSGCLPRIEIAKNLDSFYRGRNPCILNYSHLFLNSFSIHPSPLTLNPLTSGFHKRLPMLKKTWN